MDANTAIPLAGFAILVLGILIRGEVRSNANAADINDLYDKQDKHFSDRDVHHSAADLDRRFQTLEDGVDRIERGVEKLDGRFDAFLQSK